MMLASEPRDPRPATDTQVQWSVIDPTIGIAIGIDPNGNAHFWGIGAPDAPCGCACPACAPHEQADE